MQINLKQYVNFIDGKFVQGDHEDQRIPVFNPATEVEIAQVPESRAAEVNHAVEAAIRAKKSWAKLAAVERGKYLREIAAKIRDRIDILARTITEEQGKPLGLAKVEVEFSADYLVYMAEWARRIEGEILTSDRPNEHIFLFRQPIGVVAGILPWNFPFFLIVRKLAPALVTGNTIVIKPSEETPLNAFEFAEVVAETDLPPGVVNFISGMGDTVGRQLASHRDVGMVSFTGSVETGSKIMAAAAENLTKVNLELGGKAPAIVLSDANLDLAVEAIKNSRIINSGQVCNCAERVYVHRKIADEFTDRLAKAMKVSKFGNPLEDLSVDYGPLINQEGLSKVEGMVTRATKDGATVVTGGRRGDRGKGWFYEPTVLADCRQGMEIVQKEIFGPVVPVVVVEDLDQAIEYANDSEYGLTSSIYTSNIDVAMRACKEIQFGETYINRENFEAMQGFHAGWRKSGIGGADGKHGLYEYTQTHVVYLQFNAAVK
jgi:lactaldehyde dehydrogenase / glycolaldehyde dehydrogenase